MTRQTARAIASGVNAGEVSARVVSETALERVQRLNPGLNVFAHLDPAMTLAEADAVDARHAAGEDMPLAGVPVVIKDNIWVAGRPITQGSRLFADFMPPRDAEAVIRLRAAGAVILGIGTCSEFACKGLTNTPLHGITRNPCDPALTPGGSSGGPAAAVAAGFAPLALGTDAGGSSRRPPAHTGTVGLKPSQDVVPYGPGFAEPFWNISVLSPIAGDVVDVALMFDVLSGPAEIWEPDRPLRIAFAPTLGLDVPMDGAVHAAMSAAAEALRADGIVMVEAAPVWPEGINPGALMPMQWAGLADLYGDRWTATPDLFDPDLGAQITAGLGLSGVDVARALEAAQVTRDVLRSFMTRFDLIVSATTPCAAWPVDRLGPASIGGAPAAPRDHAAFTSQFNHAGLPALSLPCGRTAEGLPLGLQIGAGFGGDRQLLKAAALFERCFKRACLAPVPNAMNE
ncbi:hypothetical protein P775_22315 [Puniceibacterium antarcticum]|uniref:Amidase domain-containing protein n=1 Tax=Puniceibacterium antarcticum TaxID=1206336 RepID=A0A2G8R9Y0_9RHOB|nr:amidase [Puniceibacterium antarcticum]PIL17938.1 hypothetical protein P775_22315 [Puniceibacterium antarcticum]